MTMTRRCLVCYRSIAEANAVIHASCSRKIFGTSEPPELPIDLADTNASGAKLIVGRIALTGIQPKLSLAIERGTTGSAQRRLTIIGAAGDWGDFILKPPTVDYPELPENEDLLMHLAQIAGVRTAQHTLMRMHSGELAYITRRFDRVGSARSRNKLAVEDMCQLTERLTEDKYKGSLEQIGKVIAAYSTNPGLDAIRFYELSLFCYLTGNSDMHLKNYSLLREGDRITLAPAYDLVSTALVMKDTEETALTLNGKRSNLKLRDWLTLAASLGMSERATDYSHRRLAASLPHMREMISISFLTEQRKAMLLEIIQRRSEILRAT